MDRTNAPIWLAATFPVFFVGMWLLVLQLIAWTGGWRELAASYAATEAFAGRRFRFKSGRLGSVNYNGCLIFSASSAGLGISVLLPFRPGHRPLLVPWSEISALEHRGLVFSYVDLRFEQRPQARLRLSRGLAAALIAASGNAVQITPTS